MWLPNLSANSRPLESNSRLTSANLASLLLDKDPDVSALIHAPVPFT